MHTFKWKSILALLLIGASIALDQYWLWGILFLAWALIDLRTKRTYLLEELPRNESPVLYWIVLTMWIGFGLWALSSAPPINGDIIRKPSFDQDIKAGYKGQKAVPMGLFDHGIKSSARTLEPDDGKTHRTVVDLRSNLDIDVPKTWKTSISSIPDGRLVEIEAPHDRASLNWVSVTLDDKYPMAEYIQVMEKEIAQYIDFVKHENGRPIPMETDEVLGCTMTFREYSGEIDNAPLRVVVGYATKNKQGLLLVGIHGEGDALMKDVVKECMESLELDLR